MRLIIFFIFFVNLYSKQINVNFKNLDLVELVNITSKTINKDILVPFKLEGKVNFSSNSTIAKDDLLNILNDSLEQNGYFLQKEKDIFKVVKNKKNKSKIIKEKTKVYNTRTSIIDLTHLNAENIQKLLINIIKQRAYPKGAKPVIVFEEETNSLIINAQKKDLIDLENIVKDLDKSRIQVYIKAKIIELDEYLLNDVGFRFGILGAKAYSGGLYTFSSNLNNGNAISFDTSSIGLEIPNISSSLALGASLSLLKQTYALNIVSEPSLLCLNNKESSIYVGETISIQTGSTISDGGNTVNVLEREDIGLTLKIKPRVFEKKVLIDIDTKIEGVKTANITNSNPDTSKKHINTTAFVNNGESVILGGLIESKSEKSIEEIPYMSEIPMIGELFKNRYKDNRTKNLLIIVTPYIIPKNKDLTYLTKQLSKLKALEDKFLEESLINLKKRKNYKNNSIKSNKTKKSRFENYFKM